jgi:signal transduction histidine kinase
VTEIADTGTGISPQDQKKLFSPYFTTKEKGTGLGLSSSKQIVERHSGKLSFHSRPGKTVFRVELPALKEQKAA